MITKGFIQLNRDILNWQWYGDIYTARLFLHLLLTANYEECEWKGQTVKAGQRIVSMQTLADETGISRSQVFKILERLKKSGEIERERNGSITIITLNNYNSLLGLETSRKQTRNKQETNRKQSVAQCNNIIKKENNNNNKYNAFKNFNSSGLDLELMEQTALAKYRRIPQD